MNVDVVVDAGNSFIKWGRCAGGAVVEMASLARVAPATWDAQLLKWKLEKNRRWIVAGSSAPRRDRLAEWLGKQDQDVRVLNSCLQLPITLNVNQPEKVGLDRLLNAVAVNTRKPKGVPAVIIDAGTAVTADYVDEAGIFQGGAILPGMAIMARFLHEHTAGLPLIKPAEVTELAASVALPGKSTAEAMVLGLVACFWGGVGHVAQEYMKRSDTRAVFYLGGGDGARLAAGFKLGEHHLWPEMTLEGIRIAGEQLPA